MGHSKNEPFINSAKIISEPYDDDDDDDDDHNGE